MNPGYGPGNDLMARLHDDFARVFGGSADGRKPSPPAASMPPSPASCGTGLACSAPRGSEPRAEPPA